MMDGLKILNVKNKNFHLKFNTSCSLIVTQHSAICWPDDWVMVLFVSQELCDCVA
jgi:hypothetical protein